MLAKTAQLFSLLIYFLAKIKNIILLLLAHSPIHKVKDPFRKTPDYVPGNIALLVGEPSPSGTSKILCCRIAQTEHQAPSNSHRCSPWYSWMATLIGCRLSCCRLARSPLTRAHTHTQPLPLPLPVLCVYRAVFCIVFKW